MRILLKLLLLLFQLNYVGGWCELPVSCVYDFVVVAPLDRSMTPPCIYCFSLIYFFFTPIPREKNESRKINKARRRFVLFSFFFFILKTQFSFTLESSYAFPCVSALMRIGDVLRKLTCVRKTFFTAVKFCNDALQKKSMKFQLIRDT